MGRTKGFVRKKITCIVAPTAKFDGPEDASYQDENTACKEGLG